MPAAPTSQFLLRVAATDGQLGGPEVVEALALELRSELADAGATRVDQVRAPGVPEGARGIDVLAACSFVITAVQAGEALVKIVMAIRQVVARFGQRRQPVRVTVGGIDIDLAGADDRAVQQIVRALLTLPAQRSTGVREALVVANARYDDPELAQLRSPGHDAEALARVLGDPGIGGFDVGLLLDADERTIRRRIAAFFADRDRDDLLLLHFSCHGIKDARGRLHLATRDTDLSVLGATSVPASFVHDALEETQSRRVVLILDCCYSGAFARGTLVRSGNDVQIADEFGAGSGRIVLTASSATEYAFEGVNLTQSNAQPSVFTAALVGGLESGAADLDADGEISIDELYDYTYRQVRERTPGQAPMKWSFGVEGSLVVARSVRPAELPQSIADDLASDRVVLRLEAVRALAQLLSSGKAGLRAAALAALAGVRDVDDSVQVRRAAAGVLAAEGAADVSGPGDRDDVILRPHAEAAIQAEPAPAPPEPAPPEPTPPEPARLMPESAPPQSARVRPETAPVTPESMPAEPALVTPEPALVEPKPGPMPWDPEPPRREPRTPEPRKPEPVSGTPTAAERVPAGSGLLVTAGLLVPVSVLLYAVGVYGVADVSFSEDWYHNLIWPVQLVVAVLVLSTRRARWGGLLFGVLAWSWVDLAPVVHSDSRSFFGDAWGFLVVADIIAIAAEVCLGVALLRVRGFGGRIAALRVVVAVLLALLAFTTTQVLVPMVYEGYNMDLGEGGGVRAIAQIACAVVIPVAVLVPLPDRAASFVPVGWWLGGAELALTPMVDLSRYGISDTNRQKVIVLWILLFLTVGATIASAQRTGGDGRDAVS